MKKFKFLFFGIFIVLTVFYGKINAIPFWGKDSKCQKCHTQNLPNLNSFGREFKNNGFDKSEGIVASFSMDANLKSTKSTDFKLANLNLLSGTKVDKNFYYYLKFGLSKSDEIGINKGIIGYGNEYFRLSIGQFIPIKESISNFPLYINTTEDIYISKNPYPFDLFENQRGLNFIGRFYLFELNCSFTKGVNLEGKGTETNWGSNENDWKYLDYFINFKINYPKDFGYFSLIYNQSNLPSNLPNQLDISRKLKRSGFYSYLNYSYSDFRVFNNIMMLKGSDEVLGSDSESNYLYYLGDIGFYYKNIGFISGYEYSNPTDFLTTEEYEKVYLLTNYLLGRNINLRLSYEINALKVEGNNGTIKEEDGTLYFWIYMFY